MDRRLALRRETLAELTSDALALVAGAGTVSQDICFNWPTRAQRWCDGLSLDCLTGYYPSINAPCTTN